MYINDWKAVPITFIKNDINFKLLINLVTLNTLNALKTLTDLNAERDFFEPDPEKKNNSIKLNTTIIASNIFITSEIYPSIVNPINFNPNSIVKIIVNASLN